MVETQTGARSEKSAGEREFGPAASIEYDEMVLRWLDRYVRGMRSGYGRLTARSFDDSADVHSIGAGTYDAGRAAADPTDTAAGNVPYTISGLPVADRLSFYYDSQYSLSRPPRGAKTTCVDMRAGCPRTARQRP